MPYYAKRRTTRLRLECLESRSLLNADLPALPYPGPASSLIVRFADTARAATEQALLTSIGASVARTFQNGSSWLALAPGADVGAALATLRADPSVAYAVPDRVFRVAAAPNDPQYPQQTNLTNTAAGGVDINALGAWNVTTGRTSTIVAVTDTGIDYTHPDLYLNVAINAGEIPAAIRSALKDTDLDGVIGFRDLNSLDAQGHVVVDPATTKAVNAPYVTDSNGNGYIDAGDLRADPRWLDGADNDGDGYVDDLTGWNFHDLTSDPLDDHGHGTHVSGIIDAVGNNAVGVVGVAWNVQILPLKFLGADGSGDDADAISAIEYAADHGAKVINASWGDTESDPALLDAINYAGARGTVFVAAAGNDGTNNDASPFYPAYYHASNQITVAATDSSGRLASFSNYGATTVDLAAPGVNILSTDRGGAYGRGSGTSYAAPEVSGAVALLAGLQPGATPQQLVRLIDSTARPLSGLAGKTITGGVLNVGAAVAAAAPTNRATGGTATASSDNSARGEGAAQAFDGSASTKWLAFGGSAWLQYQFAGGAAYAVSQYKMTAGADTSQYPGRAPRDWTLQGSNDGFSWAVVDTQSGQADTVSGDTRTYLVSNTTAYKYYRLNVTSSNGDPVIQLAELQLLAPDATPPAVTNRATGGVASASNENSANGEGAAQAFDGQAATKWLAFGGSAWLQYQFAGGAAYAVSQYKMTAGADTSQYPGRAPRDWTLQGSNDGASWAVVDTQSGQADTVSGDTRTYTVASPQPFKYYRLNVTASNGAGILQLAELQLLAPDATPPAVTNRATGGVASASNENSANGEGAAQAFDGSAATKWLAFGGSAWLQYQFGGGLAYAVTQYRITSGADTATYPGRAPRDWTLQGSNDGTTWAVLDTQTNQADPASSDTRSYTLSNTTAYKYYRLNITSSNGDPILQLAELQLLA